MGPPFRPRLARHGPFVDARRAKEKARVLMPWTLSVVVRSASPEAVWVGRNFADIAAGRDLEESSPVGRNAVCHAGRKVSCHCSLKDGVLDVVTEKAASRELGAR